MHLVAITIFTLNVQLKPNLCFMLIYYTIHLIWGNECSMTVNGTPVLAHGIAGIYSVLVQNVGWDF